MLSKFAKEQNDIKTKSISVSPNSGYSSWFNVWNTQKNDTNTPDFDSDTSDNEIFKLSEDENNKFPVNIEKSPNEERERETETETDTDNEETIDKYLGSKKCLIDDNKLPYNYSLLYEDINKTKSICQKIVNDNIQKWNNTSEAFKLYVISIGSMYLGIAEPVALFTITYCFLSKFDEKNNIEPLSDFDEEETCDADNDSSDCAADSEQD